MITNKGMIKIVSVMNKVTCSSDRVPSKLLMSHVLSYTLKVYSIDTSHIIIIIYKNEH